MRLLSVALIYLNRTTTGQWNYYQMLRTELMPRNSFDIIRPENTVISALLLI
jgi:hypothetical protein